MVKETLSLLSKKVGAEEDPEVLLREIFTFIKFEPANIEIYFKLLHTEDSLKVSDLKKSLTYSERTIRNYLASLLEMGYIKQSCVERHRPCYAYSAVSSVVVWRKMVSIVRKIRKKAQKSFTMYEKQDRSQNLKGKIVR